MGLFGNYANQALSNVREAHAASARVVNKAQTLQNQQQSNAGARALEVVSAMRSASSDVINKAQAIREHQRADPVIPRPIGLNGQIVNILV